MRLLHVTLPTSILVAISSAQSVSEALASEPDLSDFTSAFAQSPLFVIEADTARTIVAPNNDAFGEFLNSSAGAAVASSPDLLEAILSYHNLLGPYGLNTAGSGAFIRTALSSSIYTNVSDGVRVQFANDYDDPILISGMLQTSRILKHISFDQGYIHIIDRVMTVPQNWSATAIAADLTAAVGAMQLSAATYEFVNDSPDRMLILPNNDAFQNVGDTLEGMSWLELNSVMAYHIVYNDSGVVYPSQLEDGMVLRRGDGGVALTVHKDSGSTYFNGAKVLGQPLLTSNGIIYVVDQVLNHRNYDQAPGEAAFPDALSASTVPFANEVPTATSVIATYSATSRPTSSSESESGSSSSSSSDNGSSPNTDSSSASKPNVGAIAGGVIGGVLGIAFAIFLFWFIRRRGYSLHLKKNARNNRIDVTRSDTTTSYHKPELEGSKGPSAIVENVLSDSELGSEGTPVARTRTELSAEEFQRAELSAQHEKRMAELDSETRVAELDHQTKMADIEHQRRMAELDMSAARLRTQSRTLSELEASPSARPSEKSDAQ